MKRNRRLLLVVLSALLLVLCMLCFGACRKQVQNSDEELPPDDGELVTVTGIEGDTLKCSSWGWECTMSVKELRKFNVILHFYAVSLEKQTNLV